MNVTTHSEAVQRHRQMLLRLLLSEHPVPCAREQTQRDCELERLGRAFGILGPAVPQTETAERAEGFVPGLSALWRRVEPAAIDAVGAASVGDPAGPAVFDGGLRRPRDTSAPSIAVDHQACILCDRCIRACDEIQCNDVIGRYGKGHAARIAFDMDAPMGASTCVSCGECVAVCPTGALTNKPITGDLLPRGQTRAVDTVCPYCGVGCAITVHATPERIVEVTGRESPVNHGRLCVKGRYGWDYALHPDRLRVPLIRRSEFYPKGPLSAELRDASPVECGARGSAGVATDRRFFDAFREATWEEAIDLLVSRLGAIRDRYGSGALAGFGSAKCSNEEAYLFQRLVRAGFGTNNVDHCTRLCHATSVAALLQTIGSGAVTNVFGDVARADVILVTGSNTCHNHPVAATFIKQAARAGKRLIVVDVRRHELAAFAEHFAQIRPGTDVAFYNGVMHELIRNDWVDHRFIATRTEGFDELRELVIRDYAPEQAARICGVAPEQIRAIARTIGQSDRMMIFWGMGIAQHVHGTDNARCLIALALMTGNVGKPGTGLHPLRGQNNVQGASDAGLIPMVFPDYQPVGDPAVRAKFEAAWGRPLDPKPGLTVVEIMDAALEGSIRGMYILGENPFLSDPNVNKVRKALASLEFLAVQDIFPTETAEFADVILPAASFFEKDGTYTNTDRRVQLGRRVLQPPGQAREDWHILCEVSERFGLRGDYAGPHEIFEEFAELTDNYRGLTYENLGMSGKLWPCPDPENGDGRAVLFDAGFPTPSGKGRFVLCPYRPPHERPDEGYPWVLTTGRVLEHWHTGSMTRRSRTLHARQPEAFAAMHPDDLEGLGLRDGQRATIASRRGAITLTLRADETVERGMVFIPFHFREAAANVLTVDALDPDGKIPEFKYCAVRVSAAEPPVVRH
ncbi:MAG: formate dehydrogenase subunit alpha [Planctomycetota bacterium]|nr:MAG: formate dehydrogenase subunit alpha [Planctomycetota bacterium]